MSRNRNSILSCLTLLVTVALVTGCGKREASDDKASGAGAATVAAPNNSEAIKQVQDNPNIPPQAKATIMARMQGKGDATGKATAPPAPAK